MMVRVSGWLGIRPKIMEEKPLVGIQASGPRRSPMPVTQWLDRLARTKTQPVYFAGAADAPSPDKYDVVIIGAGPAGVSAAIYAVRRKLKTLLLDKANVIGGYVANTSIIENYPADFSITGQVLADRYTQRLNQLNTDESGLKGLLDIKLGQSVTKVLPKENGEFEVKMDPGQAVVQSRAVIIASGVNRKKVPIKRFQELLYKGVSMCTICDGPLYKNKDVAIIGHNQAAVDAALYMATLANKVYFVASKAIEASPETLAALRTNPKVAEVFENTAVTEFKGTALLESMIVKSKTGPFRTIPLQGAFLETDLVSSAKYATGTVALDAQGQVVVDDELGAGLPGLYAAGDVTPVKYKQITIAEGQGATAALRAAEFLQGKDIKADYGKNSATPKKPAKPGETPPAEGTDDDAA